MKNYLSKVVITVLFLLVPLVACANMVWPSLYIIEQYYSWYVILAGLCIEIIAAHMILKTTWMKSAHIMFVVNALSAIIGLFLIPVSGLVVEILTIPFGNGTFHLSHWILDYICVVLVNTIVEGEALKLIYKYSFKSNFLWLFCANLLSVVLCLIFMALYA